MQPFLAPSPPFMYIKFDYPSTWRHHRCILWGTTHICNQRCSLELGDLHTLHLDNTAGHSVRRHQYRYYRTFQCTLLHMRNPSRQTCLLYFQDLLFQVEYTDHHCCRRTSRFLVCEWLKHLGRRLRQKSSCTKIKEDENNYFSIF